MIKVTIVDDHPDVRTALEKMINGAEGFELTGSYGDGQEAIVLIPLLKPDLVLMDIHLGNGVSGIDCISQLKPDYPEILFMICTVLTTMRKYLKLFAQAPMDICSKEHLLLNCCAP